MVLAAAVVAAGGGWVAGRNIRSPAQVAAEAEPPEPSLITVEVELVELTADVVTRADIGYDAPATLSITGSIGGEQIALIATAVPVEGDDIVEGQPVIEVSGRPILALQGDIPMYRDLRPGAEGPDVLQLEEALARLGLLESEPDGILDDDSEAAITEWYELVGYRPNGTSDVEEAQLDAARARVRGANQAVTDAQGALGDATAAPDELAIRQAEAAVAGAQDQLSLARGALTDGAVQNERSIVDAEVQRSMAASDYSIAQARWQIAQTGVHPDTGALPTPIELERLRLDLEAAESTLLAADQRIQDARTQAETSSLQLEGAIRNAELAVAAAEASFEDLMSPPDTARLRAQVSDARQELADAQTEFAEIQAAVGIWVPAGEIVFLPRLPVRIDRLSVQRGDRVDGSYATVTGSDLAVRGAVSERDVSLVREGAIVWIDDRSLSEPIAGTIRLVDDRAGTRTVASDRHYVEIVAEGIPEELIGSNVRVVIPVGGTAGPVLAVPASALSATADGASRVEVAESDGSTRLVTVEVGLAARGLVEVSPVDGELDQGDLVVVGVAAGG